MIKVTKQQSLFVRTIIILVTGMLAIPVFQALTKWFSGFVWPWSPWEHWYGWVVYAVVWFYAFIAWAFSWVAQYVLWLFPIGALMVAVMDLRERREEKVRGYKKIILFQTRQLAKTWQQDTGFGSDQMSAFLNAVHLALSAGIHKSYIQMWFLLGFRQGNSAADQILEENEFELLYPSSEGKLATQPELWTKNKPCLVH